MHNRVSPMMVGGSVPPVSEKREYSGSVSCRECHERFYKLWAPSRHGKAMQPFTPELAAGFLTPQPDDILIGSRKFRAHFDEKGGWISQSDAAGTTNYPIVHVMGGKNVFYFLTPRDRGRLQVLPLAYNVVEKEWYNATASMVRHFSDGTEDSAVEWNDRLLTFNTACHDCHVSQMSKDYNPETDSYHTTWSEPGINCETCHGPASEHVRVCREAPAGSVPEDLKIILTSAMTHQELNDTCAPCHAKGMPIADGFMPKKKFYDHYDLTAPESPDFYPDGRDLGENYTMTTWAMSRCNQSGELDCNHCHTSSGRFRFKESPNQSCLPCHQSKVDNISAHSHHPADMPGSPACVSCHMPMTSFALMRRSDHSMRPPVPEATLAFGSPNACNICHIQNDPEKRAAAIRSWYPDSKFSSRTLHVGSMIKSAREADWKSLADMLAYLENAKSDPLVKTSLIRMLSGCHKKSKWSVLRCNAEDPSPLVRSAAVGALAYDPSPEADKVLLKGVRDEIRLVRIRAASSLQQRPRRGLSADDTAAYNAAIKEYENSFLIWPDRWSSHYNLGLFYAREGETDRALGAFEKASDLRPDVIQPLVNASMLYAGMRNNVEVRKLLNKVLEISPEDPVVNLNLALLEAEEKNMGKSEQYFRAALAGDPRMAQAAYNLGILLAQQNRSEGLEWCRKAAELEPETGAYAYTYAFFLVQDKKMQEAVDVLTESLKVVPEYADSRFLLANLYQQQGEIVKARQVYLQMMKNESLPLSVRKRASMIMGR